MRLSSLGEFGLIEFIKKQAIVQSSTILGIGDDAAAIEFPSSNKKYLLITTDSFVEGVHFVLNEKNKVKRRKYFFNLGIKVLVANVSDVLAMGGTPTHALITLGLNDSIGLEDISALYEGINYLARKYKIDLIGGDTVSSFRSVFISMTLLGEVEKKNILTRAKAKEGDLIAVTGEFGNSASKKFNILDLKFKIRFNDARNLAKTRLCSSMIDSSDGLARSVIEICKASETGARVLTDKIPRPKNTLLDDALYGGEEYEFVFTVPKSKFKRMPNKIKNKITVIGEIVSKSKGVRLIGSNGKSVKMKGGFEHFKQKPFSK